MDFERVDRVRRTNWRRIVVGGAVWALVYNSVWGVTWFVFMRREWDVALSAIGRTSPWTGEVWVFWIVLTGPMGVAIMAYSSGRGSSRYTEAVIAATAVWLVLSFGMAAYGLSQSLSIRLIAFDSATNLAGMVIASLAAVWSQRERLCDGNVERVA